MTDTANPPSSSGGTVASSLGGSCTPGTFTPEQTRTVAEDLTKNGSMTVQQANAALAADGLAPLPDPAAEAAQYAELSPEAKAIDAAFPVPKSPTEYVIPKLTVGDAPLEAEHIAFDKQARGWLMDARFPKELGSTVAGYVAETDAKWSKMDQNARDQFIASEKALTQRLLGPNADERLKSAIRLVNEIEAKRPGIKYVLEQTGAGHTAQMAVQLVMHAERLAARRK